MAFGSWRRFVSASVTFAVVLVGLIGAAWAIGAAHSDVSTNNTAQNLEPVFDALLNALAYAPYLLAGLIAVSLAVAVVLKASRISGTGGGIR